MKDGRAPGGDITVLLKPDTEQTVEILQILFIYGNRKRYRMNGRREY
jgi:hypothetical protein